MMPNCRVSRSAGREGTRNTARSSSARPAHTDEFFLALDMWEALKAALLPIHPRIAPYLFGMPNKAAGVGPSLKG